MSRCFTGENGAQFVMTGGSQRTLEWSVMNLVLQASEKLSRVSDPALEKCGWIESTAMETNLPWSTVAILRGVPQLAVTRKTSA